MLTHTLANEFLRTFAFLQRKHVSIHATYATMCTPSCCVHVLLLLSYLGPCMHAFLPFMSICGLQRVGEVYTKYVSAVHRTCGFRLFVQRNYNKYIFICRHLNTHLYTCKSTCFVVFALISAYKKYIYI